MFFVASGARVERRDLEKCGHVDEWGCAVTLGVTPTQSDLLRGTGFVADRVGDDSIWAVLARDGDRLFGDWLFADLFTSTGRRSVPPRIVATVMVLQRWCGMSDREAVAAFEFDARWKFACGGLAFDYPGFAHTVLVDLRARLAGSDRPRRIFEVTLPARRGCCQRSGCWTRHRCMTRSLRRTR